MKYAVRTLLRTPAFTVVAIVTIALGIAVNSAIFTIVNSVLLRPLPFRDEGRIVRVWTRTSNESRSNHSAGEFLDLTRANRSFEAIAGFRPELAAVSATPGQPQQLGLGLVTGAFFDVLGTPAALGRTFSGGETPAGRVVVLSDDAWKKLFSNDRGVIGRTVRVNGEPSTVVAVMPPRFQWTQGMDLWQLTKGPVPPSPIDVPDPLTNRDSHYFEAVARLEPGITLAQAQQDVHLVATALQRDHPEQSAGRDFSLVPVREDMTGDVHDMLLLAQGAVGLVLLIACANVSSLLIARASGRRRELAVRAALGARRLDLIRQLLTESLALGIAGGAVGLLLGSWIVGWLVHLLPDVLPRASEIHLDATVAVVTLAASLATGILFGILPAMQASRAEAGAVIKEAGERGSSARAHGRATLVIAEIALTLVLLAGAGLLANSFLRLARVQSGFRPEHVTVAELLVPQTRYPKGPDQTRLYHRLLDALSTRPQFQAIAVGFPGPLRGDNARGSFYVDGASSSKSSEKPFAYIGTVSGGYFAAMGIPLIQGRTFTEHDDFNAPPVAVVSLALAKKYWGSESPIGKHVRFDNDPKQPPFTVVGLAGDSRQLGLNNPAPPLFYIPYEQFALPFTTVIVRSGLPERDVTSALKTELARIDGDLAFGDITPLGSMIATSMDQPKFRALLIATFALMALVLAAVGVYGLISYTVAQRTREIGIRVALGASPRQVLTPVVREGIVLALAGIGVGLVGALVATREIETFLYDVRPSDPITLLVVALLLLAVAGAASYVPSRRALRVDPVVALRAE